MDDHVAYEVLSTQLASLSGRVTALEERLAGLERRVHRLAQRMDENQRQADARIDALTAEQLEPTRRDQLIALAYTMAARIEALEYRSGLREAPAGQETRPAPPADSTVEGHRGATQDDSTVS